MKKCADQHYFQTDGTGSDGQEIKKYEFLHYETNNKIEAVEYCHKEWNKVYDVEIGELTNTKCNLNNLNIL